MLAYFILPIFRLQVRLPVLTLFLTVEAKLLHRLSGTVAICLGSKSFFRSSEEKLTRRVKLIRLSFVAQLKIEVLLSLTDCRKVLRKMSALGVRRQIVVSQCFSRDMIDDMRDALCKELFLLLLLLLSLLLLLFPVFSIIYLT